MDEGYKFWEDMIKRGFNPDIITYNTLIHGLCNLGRMEKAVGLLHELKNEGLVPDLFTFSTMMDGYCKAKEVHKAKVYLNELASWGLEPYWWLL